MEQTTDWDQEMNFQIERLKQLPQKRKETWQGGLSRMPAWVQDQDQAPYRPWTACWVSLTTKLIHITEPTPAGEINFETAYKAFVDFACNEELAGYRPGKIQVKDPALAEHLSGVLAEADISVEQRAKLFVLDEMIADMAEHVAGQPSVPAALDQKGVSMEAMHAFAEAASCFYQARPWLHLTDADLVEIESPRIERSLQYFVVLGAGGQTYGLAFFDSVSQFESLIGQGDHPTLVAEKYWSVFFGSITELPFEDADLWEDHELPVAGENAYPIAVCLEPGGKQKRPGPDVLAFLEGLMRSIAVTTEDEMDAGRWSKGVTTAKGTMQFELSLPGLLESDGKGPNKHSGPKGVIPDRRAMERTQLDIQRMVDGRDFGGMDELQAFLNANVVGKEIPHQADMTPLEEAQDLVYQAFEARGRRQLQLARKALSICPDCTDAYVVMAERCSDLEKAADLYAQGVVAGERALGQDFFEKEAGHFWGILHTRPYMRARLGLAQCLEEMGDLGAAAAHYREMLRLNPGDNQGVRHMLLPCLLEMNADDEAAELLKQCKDDRVFAIWCYTRALLTFRQKGDTATARKHIEEAISVNGYVPKYLLEYEEMPEFMPAGYSPGSKDEAVICSEQLAGVWKKTEGALRWLDERVDKL